LLFHAAYLLVVTTCITSLTVILSDENQNYLAQAREHIKQLMIKQELAKDPKLANEDWSRFPPQFARKNVQTMK